MTGHRSGRPGLSTLALFGVALLSAGLASGGAPGGTATGASPDEAQREFDRAQALRDAGKYAEAIPAAERALALREKSPGPDDLAVADALHLLALLFDDTNDYAKAEPLNRRALAIREKALGPDHPDVARSLFNLAWIAKSKSEFAEAEALYQRALAIQEKAFGPDHPEVATVLNDLAVLYDQKGDYDRAIEADLRVLTIREKALGPDDPGVAKALNNLAQVHENQGDYPAAVTLLDRAVAIWAKALGPDHPELAFGLDSLGSVLVLEGDYARAEPNLERALALREKSLGPDHPEVATSLNNLAVLLRLKGDYTKAEGLLRRDLAITEKRLGPSHRFVAPTLVNLAEIKRLQGDDREAEPLYRRALAIYTAALGPDHPDVGWTMSLLGRLCAAGGGARQAEAAELLDRSLAILEKALGPEHPRVASPVFGLATLAANRGDRAEAETLQLRALSINEKAFGDDHPDVAQSLQSLAELYRAQGDAQRAVEFMTRSQEIRERHLAHNLLPGSERQKAEYLKLFAEDADRAIALHAEASSDDPRAARLALTSILRRKGRALDAMTDSVAILRRNSDQEDRARFDRLSSLRSQLAAVSLRRPIGKPAAYRAQLARLQGDMERLEAEIGADSAVFRSETVPVTLDAVQAAIPAGACLVEFALYRAGGPDGAASERLRYAAYTLAAGGDPGWADLGEAAGIEAAIRDWRAALRDPQRADATRLARALDARIMQPVRALVGPARRLLVSPDGALNLIPFAALVDEENRPLVERWTMTYLTSGRDLLRLQVPRASRNRAAIVASPAFGDPALAEPAGGAPAGGPARVDTSRMFFGPLPGAADEVRALRKLLPQATLLTGDQATEAALRRLQAPEILHLATHGFFREGRTPSGSDDPLLRAGLAMAGANPGKSGADDGLLTALEAAGLDLWGTRLVVLSACDTAVGEVRRGDGVFGLRRAFVLAGSESQLMSLWPVSDRATRDLMIAYYRQLTEGAGRAEALRQGQLKMLADGRRSHPYYWAGFIESGAWGSLDGRR